MSQTSLYPTKCVFDKVSEAELQQMRDMLPLEQKELDESVAISNTKQPGFSAIYRNKNSPDALITSLHPSLNTIYDFYRSSVRAHPNKPFLGYRKFNTIASKHEEVYSWLSYRQADDLKQKLGSGVIRSLIENPFKKNLSISHISSSNFMITTFSLNRPEWMLTDLACLAYNITGTALYDSLSADHAIYILKTTESPVVVCSKDKIPFLLEIKRKNRTDLCNLISIVSMDDLNRDDPIFGKARSLGIVLHDFEQIVQIGEKHLIDEKPTKNQEDLYTISFTSGTTGSVPKGVMLSHKNGIAAITMNFQQLSSNYNKITTYCFLPLAHVYERMYTVAAMSLGYSIGFPSGNARTMFDDLRILKPNYFAAVPRVFNKIEILLKNLTIKSLSDVTSSVTSHIIDEKINLQSVRDGEKGEHPIYDSIFVNKLRHELGFDNMINVFSASAPISPETIKFLKACLNVGLCQGYGMTESFATISLSAPYEANPGTSGSICPTTEMRLKDCPEMGYTSNDEGGPRGEVLLRGPQMFPGYYKNEEQTKKDIDEEGWFHSGDIARFDFKGRLIIIDRVKNFFKLSQGEFITPEKVENVYLSSCHLINQLFVHGDPIQTHLIAIVGANPDHVRNFFMKTCGLNINEFDTIEKQNSLLGNPRIKRLFFKEMHSAVRDSSLKGFEKIHNIYIEFEPLKVSNNVLTPTLKLKRPVAVKVFRKQIDDMYLEGSLLKDYRL